MRAIRFRCLGVILKIRGPFHQHDFILFALYVFLCFCHVM